MRNPLSSEAEAYRLVWLTLGYFALIVAGALINRWLGLAVFIALSAALAWWFLRRGEREPPRQTGSAHRGAADERRILVIANETVAGSALRDCIRSRTEGYRGNVLVVAPALNSPLRHWVSDEDPARAQAQERLESSLARLQEAGIEAHGSVGDGDPLQAIEDALRTFGPDEIVISTHPEGRSNWLERGVVCGARERFTVPITHVVVDLAAERDEVR
ncbi:MAG: universal stress protein [Actinomycetota bacterium]|nr:universal stress protein [Actinomycetota bacterium]